MTARTPRLALVAGLAAALLAAEARATSLPPLQPLSNEVWADTGGGAPSGSVLTTQILATGAAAIVSIPLSLVAATALGRLSNNLVLAALPPLLTFLVLPSAATGLTAGLVGAMEGDATSWLAPWLGGMATQLVMFAAGFLLGVTTTSIGATVAFALVDAVALTAASVFLANTCVDPYGEASRVPPPLPDPSPVRPVERLAESSTGAAPALAVVPVAIRF